MATSSFVSSPSFAPAPHFDRLTFLMCPPEWYGIAYVHNPWMAGNVHRSSRDLAFSQWKSLYNLLRSVADVRLLHPEPGCPDMVFLSHSALIRNGLAAMASFTHSERRPETTFVRRWLAGQGFLLWDTPRELGYEGEGDVTFSEDGTALWAAHGVRTCRAAHVHLADAWHLPVYSLHLVDPRFYHLDTCFSTLQGGFLLYYPGAFDASSLRLIEGAFPAAKRIAVPEADALRMACCALNLGRTVFTGEISEPLAGELFEKGFDVVQLELGEFIKGGGGARSLALRLSDPPLPSHEPR